MKKIKVVSCAFCKTMNETELYDFDQQVDAMKADVISPPVIMSPNLWARFTTPSLHVWNWNWVPFQRDFAKCVPHDKHGVYTFTIAPGVAEHPLLYLVSYVGKADNMTLKARFLTYFSEKRSVKRSQIGYFLRKYDGFIMFSFCPVKETEIISEIEDSLISALMPYLNRSWPGEVSDKRRAF